MKELADATGLRSVLASHGITCEEENFELQYSHLAADARHAALMEKVERQLQAYFCGLRLPATPTLYDYLVLGLRSKDLIATFNWDPLLFQACVRNSQVTRLPGVVHLHGCVALGVCHEHKYVADRNRLCRKCRGPLAPTRLLYPVANKGYSRDPLLRDNWATLERALEEAYYLTFVGYSFPALDADAKSRMRDAWARNRLRHLAEVDAVDISPSADVLRAVSQFRVESHGSQTSRLQDAEPFLNPRRSCEALWERTQELSFDQGSPYPEFATLDDLHGLVRELVAEERRTESWCSDS